MPEFVVFALWQGAWRKRSRTIERHFSGKDYKGAGVACDPANAGYAPSPVAGIKVIARALNEERVPTADTNEDGYFRFVLTPGTYEVTLGPFGGMAFSKDVPATITIKAESEVWMDIHIDTGIR